MSNLLGILSQAVGGQAVNAISKQLGVNDNVAQSAIQSALPLLLKAIKRNASNEQGAGSLFNALKKDHDGSVLDDVAGAVGNWQNGPGAGILGHVLGGRQRNVEQYVGQSAGLDSQKSGQLLKMLAPMVMGALGKQQRSQNLDAGSLFNMLKSANTANNQAAPKQMGVLSRILDKDGDGDIKDEIAQVGMNFLGNLFKR